MSSTPSYRSMFGDRFGSRAQLHLRTAPLSARDKEAIAVSLLRRHGAVSSHDIQREIARRLHPSHNHPERMSVKSTHAIQAEYHNFLKHKYQSRPDLIMTALSFLPLYDDKIRKIIMTTKYASLPVKFRKKLLLQMFDFMDTYGSNGIQSVGIEFDTMLSITQQQAAKTAAGGSSRSSARGSKPPGSIGHGGTKEN